MVYDHLSQLKTNQNYQWIPMKNLLLENESDHLRQRCWLLCHAVSMVVEPSPFLMTVQSLWIFFWGPLRSEKKLFPILSGPWGFSASGIAIRPSSRLSCQGGLWLHCNIYAEKRLKLSLLSEKPESDSTSWSPPWHSGKILGIFMPFWHSVWNSEGFYLGLSGISFNIRSGFLSVWHTGSRSFWHSVWHFIWLSGIFIFWPAFWHAKKAIFYEILTYIITYWHSILLKLYMLRGAPEKCAALSWSSSPCSLSFSP